MNATDTDRYAQYDRHYARAGNRAPDWGRAAADPGRFARRAPWLPADKQARILDVGCGWGYNLMTLWCAGYRALEGVDISAEQAAIGNRAAGGRVAIHCADGAEFLAQREACYDLITLVSVLEHIPAGQVVPFLRLIHRALAPGGWVLVYVPNLANLTTLWIHYSDLTHVTGFTELSVQQALDQAGFEDHRFVPAAGRQLSAWRPWRPWRGLGLGELANRGLHRMIYRIAPQSPRPVCVAANLEIYSHKSRAQGKDAGVRR
jgi:SAM-dependent methyltransferase